MPRGYRFMAHHCIGGDHRSGTCVVGAAILRANGSYELRNSVANDFCEWIINRKRWIGTCWRARFSPFSRRGAIPSDASPFHAIRMAFARHFVE